LQFTFKDFFEEAAQFYYKHDLDRYRAEVIQNPNKTVKQVFEDIIQRDCFIGKSKQTEFPQ